MPQVTLDELFHFETEGGISPAELADLLLGYVDQALTAKTEMNIQFNCFDVRIKPATHQVEIIDVLYGEEFLPLELRIPDFVAALAARKI